MTREELLAKIDAKKEPWYNQITEDFELSDMELINALRAVVELHKPSNKHEVRSKCAGCYIPMPCPTIQAIKKELK